ncbi:DUF998 domain-containing protein [Pelagivirga sediminicola]|uniref:DUF998 domain-containing protein n=1 Tax=Pelagivirga sediminicola TaxID=2170575 RepID=A0A2T7G4N9_9RHOB|nr:DUF998 domain-containing protein [Pelagivirga sediminicola]PVA09384.1 DUF998 domain-containing protein [Pelagivirga sediminicola]
MPDETHARPANGNAGAPRTYRERPWLLIAFGGIGVAGCAALIVGTLIAQIVVPDHDWIADTISDLAAGRWEIIMDVALYGFAAGLLATARAASHAHMGKGGWSVGVASLASLVTIIGARNEYGDSDRDGVVIHMYLVYAMGAFFLLTCAVMQSGLRASGHGTAGWTLIALGAAWAVMCPVFLLSATSVDGLLERILGVIACGIVLVPSVVFIQRGLACVKEL